MADNDLTATVITVSTRAADGVYEDRSGPIIVDALIAAGFGTDRPTVVRDGEAVAEALRRAVSARYSVIVTTGGTGLAPEDRTPEMTRRVIEREIPQLPAAIAGYGVAHGVPTAVLSRGIAGTVGDSLIVITGPTGHGKTTTLTALVDLINQQYTPTTEKPEGA